MSPLSIRLDSGLALKTMLKLPVYTRALTLNPTLTIALTYRLLADSCPGQNCEAYRRLE